MFLVNTEEGRIVSDEEIKTKIATEHPYRQWIDQHMVEIAKLKRCVGIARIPPRNIDPAANGFRLHL